MQQIRWFDRKFYFDYEQNIFPSIIERLKGTPVILEYKFGRITQEDRMKKPDNAWSIQEHLGHLLDLEPLWQGRLEDILNGVETMRPADLTNAVTHEAGHNNRYYESLLNAFKTVRAETVKMMEALTEEDVYKSALHPRLEKPMRMMDLFLFTAEHDDHHLARISELQKMFSE